MEDTRRTLFLLTFGGAFSALVLTGVMVRGIAVSHPSGFFFFCPWDRVSVLLCLGVLLIRLQAYVSDKMDLQEKVESSARARVKDRSRKAYSYSAVRFIQWLSANEPATLNDAWVVEVAKDAKKKPLNGLLEDQFKDAMRARLLAFDVRLRPLHFQNVTTTMFLQWVHSLGTGFETASGHRSAIRGLFKDFAVSMPVKWDDDTGTAFQGLKRKQAQARDEGKEKKKRKGKKPMEFGLYCALAKSMWGSNKTITAFNVIYMLLCWNLMSRSSNVTRICFDDLDWKDDALTILFCTTKTDQGGDRTYPRHVYANPLKPEICPILALGVYLMLSEFGADDVKLFGGGNQYSHFSTSFKKWMKRVLDTLAQWVVTVMEWGTHSFRKGAATFCCSGSSAGAHISAVSNRCAWKQPGVQDTYLIYADAGDQVVGRIVCGLPLDSVNFSILPPFFTHPDAEVVQRAIGLCFPSLNGKVAKRVLMFCLASVVHHREWLRATVPKDSPLLNTVLFRDVALLNSLAALVECRLPKPSDDIRATGLPPHIAQLGMLEGVRKEIVAVGERLAAVGDKVTTDVLKGLDDRQIESHVTPTSLKQQIAEAFKESGIEKILASVQGAGAVASVAPQAARAPELVTYCWGGKLGRLLPFGYKLPSGSARDMWHLYIVGNEAQGIRPLKYITAEHVSDPNTKKRFRLFLFFVLFWFLFFSSFPQRLQELDGSD